MNQAIICDLPEPGTAGDKVRSTNSGVENGQNTLPPPCSRPLKASSHDDLELSDELSDDERSSSNADSSKEECIFSDVGDGLDLWETKTVCNPSFTPTHGDQSQLESSSKREEVTSERKRHSSSSSSSSETSQDSDCSMDPVRKRQSSLSDTLTTASSSTESEDQLSCPELDQPSSSTEKTTARKISMAVKTARSFSMAGRQPLSMGEGSPLLSCRDLVADDTKENVDSAKLVEETESSPQTKKLRTRKPLQPQRSPPKIDPAFRGVTFQMKPKLLEDVTQLSIRAYFNCRKPGYTTSRRRHQSVPDGHAPPTDHSSLGAELNSLESACPRRISISGSCKQCASCGTRKTPLWRDAEDGTPLCNACGIRYKKYRVRCIHCWHIPKKESKAYLRCSNCGETLNYKLSLFKSRLW